jgi:uncharacterized protein YutE (UPF0331/DUF86 family)
MPQYDEGKITTIVSQMKSSLLRLKNLSLLTQEEFVRDPDKVGSAKYHFIVAIESIIDMGNHVISRNGLRIPEDYADTFGVLQEAGIIDPAFSEKLVKMSKFRNRLVHMYWKIDDVVVYDILQNYLEDFETFFGMLARYLGLNNSR